MNYEQFFINPMYQLTETSLIAAGAEPRNLIPEALEKTVVTIADMFGGKYSQRRNIIKFPQGTSGGVLALAEKALGNFAEQIDHENKRIILNPAYGRVVA